MSQHYLFPQIRRTGCLLLLLGALRYVLTAATTLSVSTAAVKVYTPSNWIWCLIWYWIEKCKKSMERIVCLGGLVGLLLCTFTRLLLLVLCNPIVVAECFDVYVAVRVTQRKRERKEETYWTRYDRIWQWGSFCLPSQYISDQFLWFAYTQAYSYFLWERKKKFGATKSADMKTNM